MSEVDQQRKMDSTGDSRALSSGNWENDFIINRRSNEFWRENDEFGFIAVTLKLVTRLPIHSTNITEFLWYQLLCQDFAYDVKYYFPCYEFFIFFPFFFPLATFSFAWLLEQWLYDLFLTLLFFKWNFYQSMAVLQCCVSLKCPAKWFNYTYILFHILFHCKLLQGIEYSSLSYAVGPCCFYCFVVLSVFYTWW